jgi:oxygen-dependent protoporphyrinogen oxidase
VGHLDRLAEIERRLATLPGLLLAGGSYRGVGIPDCIKSGWAAADAAAAHVETLVAA